MLGGGCEPGEDPAEAIVRELAEEAGLVADNLTPLFEIPDEHGSGQPLTVFAGTWDGDEQALPLTEGVKLQFFDLSHLDVLTIPPHVRAAITRCQPGI